MEAKAAIHQSQSRPLSIEVSTCAKALVERMPFPCSPPKGVGQAGPLYDLQWRGPLYY